MYFFKKKFLEDVQRTGTINFANNNCNYGIYMCSGAKISGICLQNLVINFCFFANLKNVSNNKERNNFRFYIY